MDRITLIALLLIVVACVTPGRSSLAKPPQEKGSKTPAVQVDMRNVVYHFTDQVTVHILQLHAWSCPPSASASPCSTISNPSRLPSTSPRLPSVWMRCPMS